MLILSHVKFFVLFHLLKDRQVVCQFKFPLPSISEFLILVVEIDFPSSAKTIGTTTIFTEGRFLSVRNSLRSNPLLLVSALTTKAYTEPSITAGPKSFSSLLISYAEFGKLFSITDFNNESLFE